MNLEIQIVDTHEESKGKYNQLLVTYTDLNSGKDYTQSVLSFINKSIYLRLKEAKVGDKFSVVNNKNDKGYWQFDSVEPFGTKPKANTSPRSTYETPEERAQKQIYIVRQSSLTNAIALLGSKAKVEQVVSVARQFEQYVFGLDERESFDDLPTIDEDQ